MSAILTDVLHGFPQSFEEDTVLATSNETPPPLSQINSYSLFQYY